MSIEIIEKPKQKCNLCKCVYTFGNDDLHREKKMVEVYDNMGLKNRRLEVYEHSVYTECPVCRIRNVIKSWRTEKNL